MTGGAEHKSKKTTTKIRNLYYPPYPCVSISCSLSKQFKASKENISFSVRTIFFFVFFVSVFFSSSKQYENYLLFFTFSFILIWTLDDTQHLYPHFISYVVVTFLVVTLHFIMCECGMYVKPYLLTGNGISNLLLLYIIQMWNVAIGCMQRFWCENLPLDVMAHGMKVSN